MAPSAAWPCPAQALLLPAARTDLPELHAPTPSSSHSPWPSFLVVCQPQSHKLGFALNATNLAAQPAAPAVPTPASRARPLGNATRGKMFTRDGLVTNCALPKPWCQHSCAQSYQHRRSSRVCIFNRTKSAYFSDQLIETPTSSGCQQGNILFFTRGAEPIINNTKTFVKMTVLSTAYSLEASLLH